MLFAPIQVIIHSYLSERKVLNDFKAINNKVGFFFQRTKQYYVEQGVGISKPEPWAS